MRRPDGVVGVEITTTSRLGSYEWDHKVYEPEDYLDSRQAFRIRVSAAAPGEPWRYLNVRSSVLGLARAHLFDDFLDLSEGSEQRGMLESICGQDRIPVTWVNEKLETELVLEPRDRKEFRTALRVTKGVSAKMWREEIAEIKWRRSASYRPGVPRPRRCKRRVAERSEGLSEALFARRSGQIPKSAAPELVGLVLPRGSRRPAQGSAYWASDEPVGDLDALVPKLAAGFPETGLWPVLWRFPEDPEEYMGGHGDIDRIDQTNIEEYLTERARPSGAAIGFRGLAPAQPPPGDGVTASLFPDWALRSAARLLLVPCNRPADALSALGGVGGETPPPVTSALLRSWEERFGAIFYEAAPALVRLHITRPPQDHEQALALAAELHAADPLVTERAGDLHLEQTADCLTSQQPRPGNPLQPVIDRENWDIAC